MWTWAAPKAESSSESGESEDFEAGLEFNEEDLETVDVIRNRRLSEREVEQASVALQQSIQIERDESLVQTDHFSPVQVRFPVNAPALRPPVMAPTVNYDAAHADDEAENAMDKAINSLKNHAWMEEDLKFYFGQVEVKMKAAGVKSNFTKLQVLSTIVPAKVIAEIKSILTKQESEFPQKDAYLQAKTEILNIFGPCEGASVERALNRVLSGKPSQLWKALTGDLCSRELKNCCC